ncbi:protein of unknown function DUF641, plant [Dillenia turbinata]|uniref:DUF641 domain-containing protein n=1 Tax=Dillenia turbinata TaxID=194707 RepID=A0AAN8ZAB5_9MAGN
MELIKQPGRSRLARTFQKVIHIQPIVRRPNKSEENEEDDRNFLKKCGPFFKDDESEKKLWRRAVLEALIAKLFASISSIKAAYVELQNAQFPYNVEAIQSADEIVVNELRILSEIKQSYLKKEFDSSPQVTFLLAEIQEQQCLMKTFELTTSKLETEIKEKELLIGTMKKNLEESNAHNTILEKKLNSSGYLSGLSNLQLSVINPNHFASVLHYTVRSIRRFVKLIIGEMGSANWDLDLVANSITPNIVWAKSSHRCFAVESFVSREMFENFNSENFSLLPKDSLPEEGEQRRILFFHRFKNMKSVNPIHFLVHNPHSTFAKFCRTKYLNVVNPKMECSFSGNLGQRNKVKSCEFHVNSSFFEKFAEMAKRVWLFHCLAYSFDPEAKIFLVREKCRFSEVYMECVAEDYSSFDDREYSSEDFNVGFNVVPGFIIGKTVIQSQVYLSPVSR